MARFFSTLILGAVLFASQNKGVEAFSPPSRSKVLNDLKEMRMTGAGGAAQPDSYNEGESSFTWNQDERDNIFNEGGLLLQIESSVLKIFDIASFVMLVEELSDTYLVVSLSLSFVSISSFLKKMNPSLLSYHPKKYMI